MRRLHFFLVLVLLTGSMLLSAEGEYVLLDPVPFQESAQRNRSFSIRAAMYLPDLLADLGDVFSFSAGTGACIGGGVRITREFGFYAAKGAYGSLMYGPGRQYGIALAETKAYQFFFLSSEDTFRFGILGNIPAALFFTSGIVSPDDEPFRKDPRRCDYWALECEILCFLHAKIAFHPLELADFLCGIFFYDLLGDDYFPHF